MSWKWSKRKSLCGFAISHKFPSDELFGDDPLCFGSVTTNMAIKLGGLLGSTYSDYCKYYMSNTIWYCKLIYLQYHNGIWVAYLCAIKIYKIRILFLRIILSVIIYLSCLFLILTFQHAQQYMWKMFQLISFLSSIRCIWSYLLSRTILTWRHVSQ